MEAKPKNKRTSTPSIVDIRQPLPKFAEYWPRNESKSSPSPRDATAENVPLSKAGGETLRIGLRLQKHQQAVDRAQKLLEVTFKSIFLLNGGAMIAILALAGAFAQAGRPLPIALGKALGLFGMAYLATALSAFFCWQFHEIASAWPKPPIKPSRLDAMLKFFVLGMMALIIFSFWGTYSGYRTSLSALAEITR